ncbi:MAG TPA: hypothetical protein VFU22_27795, partial [Roseiflexaceae bacterium]|nr:hypothetical protein [Roseiflexaceae bacterium]
IELGNLFFQPFQLHLQAPDLLVQGSFALLDLVLSQIAVAPEQVGTRILARGPVFGVNYTMQLLLHSRSNVRPQFIQDYYEWPT